jgi:PelA/Pel-15E family pectate lyase
MSIDNPTPEIKDAIESAIKWFEAAKLTGIKVVEKNGDRVVVKDKDAPPLWARFYAIGTNKPMFSGRDGVIKDTLAEIESERRNGYSWYADSPRNLLARDYPKWQKKQLAKGHL